MLLVSSIAGVIIHIPAGIGVLEAVFIAMLSGKIFRRARSLPPCSRRALYYFLPLLLATVAYLLLESRAKNCGKEPAQAGPRMKRPAALRLHGPTGCKPVRRACRPGKAQPPPAAPRVPCLISRPAALRLRGPTEVSL